MCPAKTQIILDICLVWLESLLSTWIATHWVHSKDWSDWMDAQADLSLCWPHIHFVGFVMRWHISLVISEIIYGEIKNVWNFRSLIAPSFNPCPAEPRYALPMQIVWIEISLLLQKPTDLNLHCLSLSMWICINNLDKVIWLAKN